MRYKLYAMGQIPGLKVNNIGYSADISDTSFGPKKRDCYILCYVLSGRGVFNGTLLGAGEGFLVSPGMTEHIYPDYDDPWELLWFGSVDSEMDKYFHYYKPDENFVFRHKCPRELFEIKELAISQNRKIINDAMMLELFFSVFKHHVSTESESSAERTASQEYLEFSVNYIRTNLEKSLTISSLTRILGVSQPYLYRIFKEAFGKSPKSFITDCRIGTAKKMLSETDFTVSEIASSVGFSDSFAFSKCFSSRVGVSPTEYRMLQNKLKR